MVILLWGRVLSWVPKRENKEYWQKKRERNMKHDKEVTAMFESRGWKVLRIWECELKKKNEAKLVKKIQLILNHSSERILKAVDLFCGVGGLTYGLQKAGIPVVAGIDIDDSCEYAYAHNNNCIFIHKSVEDVTGKEIRSLLRGADVKILVGCAPCQPFSSHQKDKQNRSKHKDWKLLYQFGRLIEETRPHIVSMENVPELEKEEVFKDFVATLKSLNYFVNYQVINVANYGVPQRRKRLILLASRRKEIKLIDATPIGINVRSTVATYANVHDELRKVFAKTPEAKALGYKAGDFSYNTGKLRCPVCDGTGVINLDVQFLPDVEIPCPECGGSRYAKLANNVKYRSYSLPEIMAMDVNTALEVCKDLRIVHQRLKVLQELGLGYLTLGEQTPGLSGGEAQRLKLAGEMRKAQSDSVFVFDEPTIGLHPLDVQTLLQVFQTLIDNGATVIVIEHDLDVIKNADYIIDMGPEGGEAGGEIIFAGTLENLKHCKKSKTAKFI